MRISEHHELKGILYRISNMYKHSKSPRNSTILRPYSSGSRLRLDLELSGVPNFMLLCCSAGTPCSSAHKSGEVRTGCLPAGSQVRSRATGASMSVTSSESSRPAHCSAGPASWGTPPIGRGTAYAMRYTVSAMNAMTHASAKNATASNNREVEQLPGMNLQKVLKFRM